MGNTKNTSRKKMLKMINNWFHIIQNYSSRKNCKGCSACMDPLLLIYCRNHMHKNYKLDEQAIRDVIHRHTKTIENLKQSKFEASNPIC